MNKHTEGPWKAHPIETKHGLPYTPVSANTLIAKVYSEAFGDYAQSEANARLIAAAPKLLDALESIVDCYNCQGTLFDKQIADALAAIAEATGESGETE